VFPVRYELNLCACCIHMSFRLQMFSVGIGLFNLRVWVSRNVFGTTRTVHLKIMN
jgi:hypothetical protein